MCSEELSLQPLHEALGVSTGYLRSTNATLRLGNPTVHLSCPRVLVALDIGLGLGSGLKMVVLCVNDGYNIAQLRLTHLS